MTNNTSNTPDAIQSSMLWSEMHQAAEDAEQNVDNQNRRTAENENSQYHRTREENHARSLETAKKESIKKSTFQQAIRTTAFRQGQLVGDTVLPAVTDGMQGLFASGKKSDIGKPPMPSPLGSFSNGQSSDDFNKNMSIVAIIAAVLILQAKSNSQVWQTLWKASGEMMDMTLNMAQVSADNTKNQWQAQANATRQQADQAKEDGIVNLCMFGASMVMGAFDPTPAEEPKGPGETLGKDGLAEPKPAEGRGGEEGAGTGSLEGDEAPTRAEADLTRDETQSQEGGARQTAKQGKSALRRGTEFLQKKVMSRLSSGMKYAQGMSMASQAICGLAIDNPKLSAKAGYEQQAGQYQSAAEIAKGFGEYYNQSFSRTEEVRQGANQNLEYAMQVLKSASDAATQASNSLFSR
ncbi:MAG: hypothetical protein ACKVOH_01000 [Chlamydiales bacterium]